MAREAVVMTTYGSASDDIYVPNKLNNILKNSTWINLSYTGPAYLYRIQIYAPRSESCRSVHFFYKEQITQTNPINKKAYIWSGFTHQWCRVMWRTNTESESPNNFSLSANQNPPQTLSRSEL